MPADTPTTLLAPAAGEPFYDSHGRRHARVVNRVSGDHCECGESWACRPRMVAELARAHPADGWCQTCSVSGPCPVRRDLVDTAVTP